MSLRVAGLFYSCIATLSIITEKLSVFRLLELILESSFVIWCSRCFCPIANALVVI